MKQIGELLLERRRQLKLTQVAVAKELGFKPQFLGKIEKGAAPFPLNRVPVLCSILRLRHKAIYEALVADFESKLKDQMSALRRKGNC